MSTLAPLREAKDSLAKASTPEPWSTSRTSNWVARAGGLPDYIQHVSHDLHEKRGMTESRAIQMAVGIVKRWARGGGQVDAGTRAAAAKAVAEWEKLKAKNAAKGAASAAQASAIEPSIADEVALRENALVRIALLERRFGQRGLLALAEQAHGSVCPGCGASLSNVGITANVSPSPNVGGSQAAASPPSNPRASAPANTGGVQQAAAPSANVTPVPNVGGTPQSSSAPRSSNVGVKMPKLYACLHEAEVAATAWTPTLKRTASAPEEVERHEVYDGGQHVGTVARRRGFAKEGDRWAAWAVNGQRVTDYSNASKPDALRAIRTHLEEAPARVISLPTTGKYLVARPSSYSGETTYTQYSSEPAARHAAGLPASPTTPELKSKVQQVAEMLTFDLMTVSGLDIPPLRRVQEARRGVPFD